MCILLYIREKCYGQKRARIGKITRFRFFVTGIPHNDQEMCINRRTAMTQKEQRKPDRRIAKTKRAIHNALATLMTEKAYNEISVKDIADLADINRKTFYNYYRGVYQVVEEIENEIIIKLDMLIDETDFRAYIENPFNILKNMNSVLNEDIEFYGHLFSLKDGYPLVQKVADHFKRRLKENFIRQFPEVNDGTANIMLDYSVTGMFAVYHQWFNSDQKQSLDEVSQVISLMAANGINCIIAGQKQKETETERKVRK